MNINYKLRLFINYRIPLGTSPELSNLLMGLLKRNSVDRMAFDIFFNHVFMNKPETPKAPVDPVAFMMPVEDAFTPPKEPCPMQLAQQVTLGKFSFYFLVLKFLLL